MAIAIAVRTARLISVHNEPSTLRLTLPSITPGTYFIPGIDASDEELSKCTFSFKGREPVQYAQRREIDGKKFIEISVFEGKTAQYGTELDQKMDEEGRPMEPQLRRALLPISAEEIANELERQSVFFDQNLGIRAIETEPTRQDIEEAEKQNIKYMQRNIHETNRWSKFGQVNITEQARNHAWKLHKMGLLNPLPDWATVNPSGEMAIDTVNCINCGVVLSRKVSKCPQPGCGTILDWKVAVERGQVLPKDVPKSKRVEAGIEEPKGKFDDIKEAVRTGPIGTSQE
jgi:hypothetical protein